MERINKIINSPEYINWLSKINQAEKNRIFCGHSFSHFLDVARIMYLETLTKGYDFSQELVYSAALLHDIGRSIEYSAGADHAREGAVIAKELLEGAGFCRHEVDEITLAIANHNVKDTSHTLSQLLQFADKKSRNCFLCNAQAQCNWKPQDRNMEVSL
ncbi:HD domain-containing protein [Lacrimispora sp. 38-1]|uniref:HD domain-containing protein n=1 Tax=Lacrimispora sp. 38-1 TaxID=3125778 RepID=UPI003CE8ABFC